jgi:hypothetical protein
MKAKEALRQTPEKFQQALALSPCALRRCKSATWVTSARWEPITWTT